MKQDLIAKVVNSICGNDFILSQIDGKRIVLEGVMLRNLREVLKKEKNVSVTLEEIEPIMGIIGYQVQERTSIDFGYCNENCMNGNYTPEKTIMCNHIRGECEFETPEINLGDYDRHLGGFDEKLMSAGGESSEEYIGSHYVPTSPLSDKALFMGPDDMTDVEKLFTSKF